jgi:hypothetical protein
MAQNFNPQTLSSSPTYEMENGDGNRYKSYLNQQSPLRFSGFSFNPGASKQTIDHNVTKDTPVYNMAFMAGNSMLKIGQDVQTANFEFEDFKKYETSQASPANYYPDSPGVNTPQTTPSCYDSVVETGQYSINGDSGVETRQKSAAGYNPGGMTDPELAAHFYAPIEKGQETFLHDYYRADKTGPESEANPYQGLTAQGLAEYYKEVGTSQGNVVGYQEVKSGHASLAGNYQGVKARQTLLTGDCQAVNTGRGLATGCFPKFETGTGQKLGNCYEGAKPGRASAAGNYQGVEARQASIAPNFSELEAGPAVLEIPNSVFGSQQKEVPTIGLPAGLRADLWPKELEDFLMAWKKANYTFPEISAKMLEVFGVERSANVLSKRYRMILERDAENNVSSRNRLAYTNG